MSGSHILLRAFFDELARCGVTHACASPGSRSNPLTGALVGQSRIKSWSHIDERCAGFFALGAAKANGLPAAIICTSGTAAAELMPAVIEAYEAGVPLLVLTADRPPELRDSGAGQTIDQLKLYGRAAKWFVEVGVDRATPENLRWVRTLACRAYIRSLEGRPGPVHLNFPLREPLVLGEQLPPDESGRSDGRPYLDWQQPTVLGDEKAVNDLVALVESHERGVIVAGRYERNDEMAPVLAALAVESGYPLLADPLSGARIGDAAVAHYDALLRSEQFKAEHTPELVIRIGDLPASKALRQWLADSDARQVAIVQDGAWQDPDCDLELLIPASPTLTLSELTERVTRGTSTWLRSWLDSDRTASNAIEATLAEKLSEPLVARELATLLTPQTTLFIASSMPVRDLEAFAPTTDPALRVLSNRGANGIDGTISSAFGAAATNAEPTVLLCGDVTFAYDIGGLLSARRCGLNLTIVVVNNDGGGIFNFLPVAETPHFERHVATPPELNLEQAAKLYGLDYLAPDGVKEFRKAVKKGTSGKTSTLIEVKTDRAKNVDLHRQLWQAVADALVISKERVTEPAA